MTGIGAATPFGPGRRALVTGGASAIGLGIAERLAGLGMRVVAADRDEAALDRVADVVDATMFLLSDAAGWIPGESLNVDGGEMAG